MVVNFKNWEFGKNMEGNFFDITEETENNKRRKIVERFQSKIK